MRPAPNLVTDDDLHAPLAAVSKIGSPVPHSVSLPCDTDDSSSSGVSRGPRAGAAAAFNLDACMAMGEGS